MEIHFTPKDQKAIDMVKELVHEATAPEAILKAIRFYPHLVADMRVMAAVIKLQTHLLKEINSGSGPTPNTLRLVKEHCEREERALRKGRRHHHPQTDDRITNGGKHPENDLF